MAVVARVLAGPGSRCAVLAGPGSCCAVVVGLCICCAVLTGPGSLTAPVVLYSSLSPTLYAAPLVLCSSPWPVRSRKTVHAGLPFFSSTLALSLPLVTTPLVFCSSLFLVLLTASSVPCYSPWPMRGFKMLHTVCFSPSRTLLVALSVPRSFPWPMRSWKTGCAALPCFSSSLALSLPLVTTPLVVCSSLFLVRILICLVVLAGPGSHCTFVVGLGSSCALCSLGRSWQPLHSCSVSC